MQRRDLLKGLALAPLAGAKLADAKLAEAAAGRGGTPSDAEAWPDDAATRYASKWHRYRDMPWTGEDVWAQRLQDFEVRDGRLHCVFSGPDRTVTILTHRLEANERAFRARVRIAFAGEASEASGADLAGFRLGIKGRFADYRSAIMTGKGLSIGVTRAGGLRIGDDGEDRAFDPARLREGVSLELEVAPRDGTTVATLRARDDEGRVLAETSSRRYRADDWAGNIALLSHCPRSGSGESTPSASFAAFAIEGERLGYAPERTFGAIYFAQYTVHRRVLKLSAQLAPVDASGAQAQLQIRAGDEWRTVAVAAIHPLARVATFRVENWDADQAARYRVRYAMPLRGQGVREYAYEGTIAAEPAGERAVRVLACSCNWDVGFPDNEVVEHAGKHRADIAMFLGDQFYESNGRFGVQTSPLAAASLDYLRKWIQFGWSYRELFRHIPSLCLPDDHDVYHGNLWGAGGRAATAQGDVYARQDSGGYKLPAQWVNMAQLTQTSHMPDPVDPRPVQQGIGVYYTQWDYAGLSMGIVEDRKFKTPPGDVFPPQAQVVNGFAHAAYDERKVRLLETQLLGERQLAFLSKWSRRSAADEGLKVLVSATSFACLQTLPPGQDDSVTPSLPMPAPGEYVSGDVPTRDMDSNGWPQNRRDETLRLLRGRYALHLCGDQHLPAALQYGVDDFEDGGYCFTVPALGNIWPRRWWPPQRPGQAPLPGQPAYTGRHTDGFGNKLTVHAVANPRSTGLAPAELYDRVTGYGLVDFDLRAGVATLHCWPRQADPDAGPQGQFAGWPMTIPLADSRSDRDEEKGAAV